MVLYRPSSDNLGPYASTSGAVPIIVWENVDFMTDKWVIFIENDNSILQIAKFCEYVRNIYSKQENSYHFVKLCDFFVQKQ